MKIKNKSLSSYIYIYSKCQIRRRKKLTTEALFKTSIGYLPVGPSTDDPGLKQRHTHKHVRRGDARPERTRESPWTSPGAATSSDPGDLVAGGGPHGSPVVVLVVGGVAVPQPRVLPQAAQAPRAPLLRLRRGHLRLLGPPVARPRVRGAPPLAPRELP